jgi:hypothetical protein
MRIASDKDPTNEMRLVLADLIMEQGDKPAALEMMKKIDMTKVRIRCPSSTRRSLINESKTDEALDMLNKGRHAVPTTQAEATTIVATPTLPRRTPRQADLEVDGAAEARGPRRRRSSRRSKREVAAHHRGMARLLHR